MIDSNSFEQVPEDLQSILSDSSMFDLSAELTTKEILKRVGELGKIPQTTVQTIPAQHNSGRSSTPVVARIETDPASWQTESSVRHVGGNGPGKNNPNQGPSNSHHNGHQQNHNNNLGAPNPPYAHPSSSPESQGSHGSRGGSPSRYYQQHRPAQGPSRPGHVAPTGAT